MRKLALLPLFLIVIFFVMTLSMTGCSSKNYETNIYEIKEEFINILIKTDTADVSFLPSDEGICKVTCYEDKMQGHSVEVQNDTLMVDVVNNKKWYDNIRIGFDTPKITVYLPQAEYSSLVIEESTGEIDIPNDFNFKSVDISVSTGDVKCYSSAETIAIVASTGDVCVEGVSADLLDISVSTGKVNVTDVICDGDVTVGVSTGKVNLCDIVCKNLTSTGSTGDIFLTNVIAKEKIFIERSTGDVKFEGSDGAEIFVTTDTGDVEGSLLTDKVFITKTDTGRINVPNSVTGGRCEITTDTGDIKIMVEN